MYDIHFYKDKRGDEPTRKYINELRKKAKTSKDSRIQFYKIVAYINKLAEYGTRIGEPFVKHIEGDIWELRPNDDRIFFFGWRGNSFVLLHYFVKKTNKTPRREIEQAKSNMADYIGRSENNEC